LSRVPSINPVEQDRQRQIAMLEKRLKGLQALPAGRREAEGADEIESTVQALLTELKREEREERSDLQSL
jgi:hypothetical protein